MSRDYGRVNTAFWKSAAIRSLGDRGKLLANYLITNPHSNIIGAYLLPDAYIADDLDWPVETVRETLSELFKIGFAKRFSDGRHIVICKYLSWNPIENPNVAKAALKQADQLPDDAELIHIIQGFEPYAEHFNKASKNSIETLSERLPKPFRNQEPEPEPKPEQEPLSAEEAKASSGGDAARLVVVEGGKSVAAVEKPEWWPKRDRYGRVLGEITDKSLYQVGRAVLGESSGGLISRLKKCERYRRDWRAAMDLLLRADDAAEPLPFFMKSLRGAEIDEPIDPMHVIYPEHSYK